MEVIRVKTTPFESFSRALGRFERRTEERNMMRKATATNFLLAHGGEGTYKSIRCRQGSVSVSGVILRLS